MEMVPSMDDLLDELEDEEKRVKPETRAGRSVLDTGQNISCGMLPPSKELAALPLKSQQDQDRMKEKRELYAAAECVLPVVPPISSIPPPPRASPLDKRISHSPTPSEHPAFDEVFLSTEADNISKLPLTTNGGLQSDERQMESVKQLKEKRISLFASASETDTSRTIHTDDTEFQEALAYLDLQQQETRGNKETTTGTNETSTGISTTTATTTASTEGLDDLTASTASHIPSEMLNEYRQRVESKVEQEGTKRSYVEAGLDSGIRAHAVAGSDEEITDENVHSNTDTQSRTKSDNVRTASDNEGTNGSSDQSDTDEDTSEEESSDTDTDTDTVSEEGAGVKREEQEAMDESETPAQCNSGIGALSEVADKVTNESERDMSASASDNAMSDDGAEEGEESVNMLASQIAAERTAAAVLAQALDELLIGDTANKARQTREVSDFYDEPEVDSSEEEVAENCVENGMSHSPVEEEDLNLGNPDEKLHRMIETMVDELLEQVVHSIYDDYSDKPASSMGDELSMQKTQHAETSEVPRDSSVETSCMGVEQPDLRGTAAEGEEVSLSDKKGTSDAIEYENKEISSGTGKTSTPEAEEGRMSDIMKSTGTQNDKSPEEARGPGSCVAVKEKKKKSKTKSEKRKSKPHTPPSDVVELEPERSGATTDTNGADAGEDGTRVSGDLVSSSDVASSSVVDAPQLASRRTSEDVQVTDSRVEILSTGAGVKSMTNATTRYDDSVRLLDEGADEVISVVDENADEEGAENAIEVANAGNSDESLHMHIEVETAEQDADTGADTAGPSGGVRARFQDQVIAVVHDMAQETDTNRLTESELQLGKTKPYWIPDEDCALCMLCSSKFTMLNRRHHCRACGRVLCAGCCKDKATLAYLGEDEKKNKARVCQPCFTMLDKIQQYESTAGSGATDDAPNSSSTRSAPAPARGVLKSGRSMSLSEDQEGPGPSQEPAEADRNRRSVMFRDGLRPGEATSPTPDERQTSVRTKKKSQRKRVHVARRLASLKVEEEMESLIPLGDPSETDTEQQLQYVIKMPNGSFEKKDRFWIDERLRNRDPVEVVIKRNLRCLVQLCASPVRPGVDVWCFSSRGFASIGVDEVVLLWERTSKVYNTALDSPSSEENDVALPGSVLWRVSEMLETVLDGDQLGIRRACERMPRIHSTTGPGQALCGRQALMYRPSKQDYSMLSIPWPDKPFVVGVFLRESEVKWALASPNRILFRLGLMAGWYPTPLINDLNRESVASADTNQTVLKVFTDFRNWNYRMQHIAGSTVSVSSSETLIKVPKSARKEMSSIIAWNKGMLAWQCDVCDYADSHLVCVENDRVFNTQVLARGSTRNVTGASFVILDAGLKSAVGEQVQVTVVEDGVAVRMGSERLQQLVEKLAEGKNFTISCPAAIVRIEWVDPEPYNSQLISPIDGRYLGDKFQYGLSLARVVTTALQVPSCPEHAIRLSHVFNMECGRIVPEEEPKIFSVAEMLAREATAALDTFMPALLSMGVDLIALRFAVSSTNVEYDVGPWIGLEDEQNNYKMALDPIVPVMVNILNYLPNGFNLELHLSIVSTKDPTFS